MASGKICIFILLLSNGVFGQNYFSPTPAADYSQRTDIYDCFERFYSSRAISYNQFDGKWQEPSVAGGTRAFNGEYQHMAAIGWELEEGIRYTCGGTLISARYVLTAAHCAIQVEEAFPTVVRLGDSHLGNSDNDEDAQQFKIVNIKRHPLHRFSQRYHDIALIELDRDASLSQTVCPACLWLEDSIPSGPLHIVGYGETEQAGGLSDTLQQGQVSLVSTNQCSQQFQSDRRIPNGILESQFCAAHPVMDTCQGDSGGPIEIRRVDMSDLQYPVIVGVTSFGTACINNSIGVYTKVSHYIDWIEQETNEKFNYDTCRSRCNIRQFGANAIAALRLHSTVHLVRSQASQRFYNCTGSLIDDRFVLTSAFCANTDTGNPDYVFIPDNREIVKIDKIITHPSYRRGNPSNDVALIKLDQYLRPNVTMKPICLWDRESSGFEFISLILASNDREDHIHFKYYAKLILDFDHQCSIELQENEICITNDLPLLPGVCQLYHGGPILDNRNYSAPFLYGIIAQKSDGCDNQFYGTRIQNHLRWIQGVVFQRDELIFSSVVV
ncbi:serine protease snake-like [Uranotaenia lowii]|uniref:serine protease snake-like n=1 Tax=Uranotaenia lowii TaxID=190385 RepID=UPI002479DCDF|nr:serine protease snake-like [Uranotaenia lowii]